MAFKDRLPVSYLLFTTRGRLDRGTYWVASVLIWTAFYVLFNVVEDVFSFTATWVLYPFLFWALYATATKRLHDAGRSAWWLTLLMVPVFGPVVLLVLLGFMRGTKAGNRYGEMPGSAPDYFRTPDALRIAYLRSDERIVDDVTQLNPVIVARVEVPDTVDELQRIIREADGPVSIGGGRFSMGGQTASPHSLHIDMRGLNKVLAYHPAQRTIRVEAGVRWCDIQRHIDPEGLSVKIMQTYANFTVGGALSVNCHGRYVGLGPVILSVRSLDVVLAGGELVHCSPTERPELFFACVGCYNAVAVIATVELDLTENVAVERSHHKMRIGAYREHFASRVRGNADVIFHNADIYPPAYRNVRAVSWKRTDRRPRTRTPLMPLAAAYPLERYFIGAFARSRFGKWRREHLIDPILFLGKKVRSRNYEAGYDVLELEPVSRKATTYVLQEYFVGVDRFDAFAARMAAIFMKHRVNVINVSVRHAQADSGSLLAWAREEVFAFVVWYRQGTGEADKNAVAVWTRELIDAVIALDGAYYLPYQPHATEEQFHRAFPHAARLLALKRQLDPTFKFRNVLWDKYHHPLRK